MDLNRKIQKYIKKLHRWVSWRYFVKKLLWCLPFGVAAGAAMELAAYFSPWYYVHVWALGAVGTSLIVAFIWSFATRPDKKGAALELDRVGLKERTVTALELLDDDGFFARLQKEDAWAYLSEVKMRKQLPLAISRKSSVILAGFFAALIICAAAPSPAKEAAREQYLIAQQAKEESEKIEETAEELEEKTADGKLSAEENEAYQDLLEQLQQELDQVKTAEELEKALERAEYKIAEIAQDTESQSARESMQQLAQALGGSEDDSSGTQIADSKESDEADGQWTEEELAETKEQLEETAKLAETAEEMLENLDEEELSALSEEEWEELAETLADLAEAAENSELADLAEYSDFAQQIADASSAAAGGQLTAQQTASALAAAGSIRAQALTQLAGISTDGTSVVQGSEDTENNESGGTGSDGNGSNSGNGSGDGSGNGSGDDSGSGNGNGSGNGSGDGSGNGNGSGSGSGWNYGGKNGTEEEASYSGETVTVPGNVGNDGNLTGKAKDGSAYSVSGNSLIWSGNKVTYDQVIGSYTEQAMSEIQGANYPGGLQDLIRSYFSELNGE